MTKTINPHKFDNTYQPPTDDEQTIVDEMTSDLVVMMDEIRWCEVVLLCGAREKIFWGHYHNYNVTVLLKLCTGCTQAESPHWVARFSTLRDTMRGYLFDLNHEVTRHLAEKAVESVKLDLGEIHMTMQVETVDLEAKPSEPIEDDGK
jgi:hypothetical protein